MRRRPIPAFTKERATRLFDGCQATLIWLAVLAFAAPGSDVQEVAVWAMVAVALAAAVVALCPTLPEGLAEIAASFVALFPSTPGGLAESAASNPAQASVRGPANPEEDQLDVL